MTKEPPISWDGVSLFTSSARNAVTSVVQAKLSLCQEMFCPVFSSEGTREAFAAGSQQAVPPQNLADS